MFKVNNKVPRRTYFDVTLHVMRASLNVNNIFRGIKGRFVADFEQVFVYKVLWSINLINWSIAKFDCVFLEILAKSLF